jgi:tRNA 2-thiouridine synthesizing protein D
VKILVIVTESPWGSSLGVTALRLVRALISEGEKLCAIYFREDGVYHALQGRARDAGTPGLCEAWEEISKKQGVPLMLCSSAAQRRLDKAPGDCFAEAGLAQMMELLQGCDRVVTF